MAVSPSMFRAAWSPPPAIPNLRPADSGYATASHVFPLRSRPPGPGGGFQGSGPRTPGACRGRSGLPHYLTKVSVTTVELLVHREVLVLPAYRSPMRRIWRVIVLLLWTLHSQTLATKFLQPRSRGGSGASSLRWRSTTICVATCQRGRCRAPQRVGPASGGSASAGP